MATKLQLYQAVREQTINELTQRGNWKRFLDTAARLYKHSFGDQVLIHAQRPDATACLEITQWNKHFNRWVRRGTKGIALIDDTESYPKLRYVFDAADTEAGNFRSKPVRYWALRQEHETLVLAELVKKYENAGSSLGESIQSIAKQLATEYYKDNADEIAFRAEGSHLEPWTAVDFAGTTIEEADDTALRAAFIEASSASVAYMIMSRCGLNAGSVSNDGFGNLADFNTPDMVYALGTATGDLSERVLREIENVIGKYERAKSAERSKGNYGESNLYTSRGLSASGFGTSGADGGGYDTTRTVRRNEKDISAKPQQNPLHVPTDGGQAIPASAGGGRGGDGTVRAAATGADGTDRASERGERPAGVDGSDARTAYASGGNSAQRDNLHINAQGAADEAAPLSSADAPQMQAELNEILSSSTITSAELDAVLRDGANDKKSPMRIAARFAKEKTPAELTAFLRREYLRGTGAYFASRTESESGKGFDFGKDSHRVCAWFGADGITLAIGATARNNIHAVTIPWETAAERISQLVRAGQYISGGAFYEAVDNEKQELANRLWGFYRDDMHAVPEEWRAKNGEYPDDVAVIKSLLDDQATRQAILERLEKDVPQSKTVEREYRTFHDADLLLADLREAMQSPTVRPNPAFQPELEPAYFITDDEIDAFLTRGTTYSEGKFRTLSYFLNEHTAAERADFLKNEYGYGGGTWSATNGWHNAEPGRGISLTRGSTSNPAAEVTLKWPAAAKRIEKLIADGGYLTRAELDFLPRYERLRLVRSINTFYINSPLDYVRPFEGTTGFSPNEYQNDSGVTVLNFNYPREAEWAAISDLLDNPDNLDNLHARMEQIYNSTSEEGRYYSIRKAAMDDLAAYRAGTYTLFPGELMARYVNAASRESITNPGTQPEVVAQLTFDSFTPALVSVEEQLNATELVAAADEDKFYINAQEERFTWIYYNSDGEAGGQYAINELTFAQITELSSAPNADDFFEDANAVCKQHIVDAGTPDFAETERLFDSDTHDYTDCTEETMSSLIAAATEWQRSRVREPELPTALPYVVFDFTEGTEADSARLRIGEPWTLAAADEALRTYERDFREQREADGIGGYHKTGITVFYPSEDGEQTYRFRYDVGDYDENDSGIVKHMRRRNEWELREFEKLGFVYAPGDVTREELDAERELVETLETTLREDPPRRLEKHMLQSVSWEQQDDGAYYVWVYDPQGKNFNTASNRIPVRYENAAELHEMFGEAVTSLITAELSGARDVGAENVYAGAGMRDYYERAGVAMPPQETEEVLIITPVADLSVTRKAMQEYGYTDADMLPLRRMRALALYDAEALIYMLKPDGTAEPVFYREKIEEYDGLFGIKSDAFAGLSEHKGADEAQSEKENTAEPEASLENIGAPKAAPAITAHDFRITDDNLGEGGAKMKFRANVAAIRTLQSLETAHRYATNEEQTVLSRYVGWGGLPQAFDGDNAQWENEYRELYELLSHSEYTSARASTLNAHYTPPTVIRAMWETMERNGIRNGRLLEPGCGVGNFFGLVPENMQGLELTGIELDSVSARIAAQLYPSANVREMGFEKADFPDNYFDAAIGNVPFGDYGVSDRRYDKHNFAVHDYFIAKTLDQVRPGGVIAFITSKYTLDKKNSAIRRYIAQRAKLLGAVRLPNNAFLKNAGTETTMDILFLQRREKPLDIVPEWVHLGLTEDGIPVNSYYLDHPEMVLGTMALDKRMNDKYGSDNVTACLPIEGADLAQQLAEATANIRFTVPERERANTPTATSSMPQETIDAEPGVRDYSFAEVDGKLYYREGLVMHRYHRNRRATERTLAMIPVRDAARELIRIQLKNGSGGAVTAAQRRLQAAYDDFVKTNGRLTQRANALAFDEDASYPLLCSLEVLDDDGGFVRLADVFTKRTIQQRTNVTHCDTALDALAVSMNVRGRVDVELMARLTGRSEDVLATELRGRVFRDTGAVGRTDGEIYGFVYDELPWVTAEEYLSGNVREKLENAQLIAEKRTELAGELTANISALEAAQPQQLTAAEIDVRLGTTWIPPSVISDFAFETLNTPMSVQKSIVVRYSELNADWSITGKNSDWSKSVEMNVKYGTSRVNAYHLLEDSLNLRATRVYDYHYDADGKRVAKLNRKETAFVQQKQAALQEEFKRWIWSDFERREKLEKRYNTRFNSLKLREYDGSMLTFPGMSPEITLLEHQKNAVARTIFGGNALFAHVVGSGKTFTMIASAMEQKRLGLCQKSVFVVPNHLIGQWGAEFMRLYPAANILVTTERDFETKNRKRFCARIATGDYDAVIIGHSQFEKIPISLERQRAVIADEMSDVVNGIAELKRQKGEKYQIKQLERTKRGLEKRLEKLNDASRKDNVLTFEELGIDRLFVDEADEYKNLFFVTKQRGVAGIPQSEAQKSSDMFAKCRYIDERTGGRGIVFATGTPISNSMVEMFTMQRYLQYNELERLGLRHFDSWASTFGETVSSIELKPEGTGYRQKTRFARFYNLPELMNVFRGCADIQTAEMLDLPVPDVQYHVDAAKPSELQREMVAELVERAEAVRDGYVDPSEDNMLAITNDGRRLALDQRLADTSALRFDDSKVVLCADNVYRYWSDGAAEKHTQIVFCDMSTPKNNGEFDVYNDLKRELMERGIPEKEIAFIHDYKTTAQKKALYARVNAGTIRVVFGSTAKLGAGTNIQKRLIATHDLDCPWRPRDLEQRAGRIVRQGNDNKEVHIHRYITEDTFDAYLYQTLEHKQKFISQVITGKTPLRSIEDIDESVLSYAEIKALATGNPLIREKMEVDVELARLKVAHTSWQNDRYYMEAAVNRELPQQLAHLTARTAALEQDIASVKGSRTYGNSADEEGFSMTIRGIEYTNRITAGAEISAACKGLANGKTEELGTWGAHKLIVMAEKDVFSDSVSHMLILRGAVDLSVDVSRIPGNTIANAMNKIEKLPAQLAEDTARLDAARQRLDSSRLELEKPFEHEAELRRLTERARALEVELKLDERDVTVLDDEPSEGNSEHENAEEREVTREPQRRSDAPYRGR